jgi:uncharacterized phage protein gp47/JayE
MIVNPLIEQGRQLGVQEGRQLGVQEGTIGAKQETLIDLMQLKFGVLPQAVVERVQSITEIEQLQTFLRRVITTNRLEEMGLGNGVVTVDSVET